MNEEIDEMMNNLQQHIGEEITYEEWFYGRKLEGNDILIEINPYINVCFNGASIPFIGYGCAIKKLTLTETGEVLFYNPIIEDHYDRRNFEDISLAELQFLSCRNIISKMNKKL